MEPGHNTTLIRHQYTTDISLRFEIGEELGRGAFAKVYEATNKRFPGIQVAVKVVPREASDDDIKALENEISLNSVLLHPHILRTFEVYENKDEIILVMEKCDGGEVFTSSGSDPQLSEPQAAELALDVLSALNYLHSRGITHRDLKPQNLLRDALGIVKIADFGISKKFRAAPKRANFTKMGMKRAMKTMTGTVGYWAPEVVSGVNYDERCDLWSLGVIIAFGLTGKLPFPANDENELGVPTEDTEVTLPSTLPNDAQEFMRALLTFDFQERPTSKAAILLPWMQRQLKKGAPNGPALSAHMAQEFIHFSQAPLLARTMAAFAARHVDVVRAPHVKEVQNEFKRLDVERKGSLLKERMRDALRESAGISEAEAESITKRLVSVWPTETEEVEYGVFLAVVAFHHRHSMTAAFRFFDTDDDEQIMVGDIRHLVRRADDEGDTPLLDQLGDDDAATLTLTAYLALFEKFFINTQTPWADDSERVGRRQPSCGCVMY
mmetsp:Transcript_131592/g.262593  ORF Transcript_131592/g.262593 Transcript_131592/m.262593 type:complete len:495 (-) Transcript_131592:107-1591(-)